MGAARCRHQYNPASCQPPPPPRDGALPCGRFGGWVGGWGLAVPREVLEWHHRTPSEEGGVTSSTTSLGGCHAPCGGLLYKSAAFLWAERHRWPLHGHRPAPRLVSRSCVPSHCHSRGGGWQAASVGAGRGGGVLGTRGTCPGWRGVWGMGDGGGGGGTPAEEMWPNVFRALGRSKDFLSRFRRQSGQTKKFLRRLHCLSSTGAGGGGGGAGLPRPPRPFSPRPLKGALPGGRTAAAGITPLSQRGRRAAQCSAAPPGTRVRAPAAAKQSRGASPGACPSGRQRLRRPDARRGTTGPRPSKSTPTTHFCRSLPRARGCGAGPAAGHEGAFGVCAGGGGGGGGTC